MSVLAEEQTFERTGLSKTAIVWALFGIAVLLAALKPVLPDWLVRVPEALVLPWDVWFQALFDFIKDDLGLIYLTRAISSGLEYLLDTTANLLYGKHRWPFLGPIAWVVIVEEIQEVDLAWKTTTTSC